MPPFQLWRLSDSSSHLQCARWVSAESGNAIMVLSRHSAALGSMHLVKYPLQTREEAQGSCRAWPRSSGGKVVVLAHPPRPAAAHRGMTEMGLKAGHCTETYNLLSGVRQVSWPFHTSWHSHLQTRDKVSTLQRAVVRINSSVLGSSQKCARTKWVT